MAGLSNSDRKATNFWNPSSRFPKIAISDTGFGSNMVTSNRCDLFWHARAKESCSSAGPTASGRLLEPQAIILILSEQEAQDPAGPANVRQPLVAETRKCNVRNQLCRQPQAAHSSRRTCRTGLHNVTPSSRLLIPSTACATSPHDLASCNTDKTTRVAAKEPCCCGYSKPW